MANKKALIIGEAFYPEDFIINDLVNEWHLKGYELEVLTRTPSYPFGKIYNGYKNKIYQQTDFNGVKIHRFPVIPGYQKSLLIKILNYLSFIFWGCLVALFIGRKFSKVFVYQTGPLTLAIPAILIKKIYGASVTIWTQDLWPDTVYAFGFKKTRLLKWSLESLAKHIYRNCTNIIVSCKGFIPKIQNFVKAEQFYWIPNWSLVKYIPKVSLQLPGKFNFTFAGNIGKVQNLENVILGFGLFVVDHPESYLNIIGDGSNLQTLKDLVSRKNIANINFIGRKPLNAMSSYFQASDVLVISLINSPIFELTIPSKFQAYLDTAKPILGIINGEVSSLIQENKIGYTADPDCIVDIQLSFKNFEEIPKEELAQISKNSKKLMESRFSRSKLIEELTTIFWS